MKGAFRCQTYEEWASLYNKWLKADGLEHEPLFVFAIKIFGKLGEAKKVREVYERALKALKLSEILAAARINVAHASAIRACHGAFLWTPLAACSTC
jgi:hypothetical protein